MWSGARCMDLGLWTESIDRLDLFSLFSYRTYLLVVSYLIVVVTDGFVRFNMGCQPIPIISI